MKYTRPAYVNEKIETADVICESMYTVAYATIYETDSLGNIVKDEFGNPVELGKKTVIGISADKLF